MKGPGWGWLDWPGYLVPYRFRRIHRMWARMMGFFWLPCPVCGNPFGGHEWRDRDGKSSLLPKPGSPGTGQGICPRCTLAGMGS